MRVLKYVLQQDFGTGLPLKVLLSPVQQDNLSKSKSTKNRIAPASFTESDELFASNQNLFIKHPSRFRQTQVFV